jgi:hypothetical protein
VAGSTVFVGCRLRSGVRIGGVHVRGFYFNAVDPDFRLTSQQAGAVRGFIFTEVPRRAWEEWLKANAEADIVVNKFVIAGNTLAEAHHNARTCGKLISNTPDFA